MKYRLFMLFVLLTALMILGCGGPNRTVQRTAVEEQIDLSGDWNDTDSQLVSKQIVDDVLSRAWLGEFTEKESRKPVVIVGRVKNNTSEHIDADTFVKDIERELINSGSVKFVASSDERMEARKEVLSQQDNSSEETAKRLAQETGADYMLQGSIKSTIDAVEGKKVKYYQTDMELIQLGTNEKVWLGTKKIKKLVEQKSHKW